MQTQKLVLHENTVGEVGEILFSNGRVVAPLFTVAQYAEICEVSDKTVQRWIDEGRLIGIKISRMWFVQPHSLTRVAETLDNDTP